MKHTIWITRQPPPIGFRTTISRSRIALILIVVLCIAVALLNHQNLVPKMTCHDGGWPSSAYNRSNVFDANRYVSQCSKNFDNRRLGNQLFNFAAMTHVAWLTGRQVAMPRVHPYGWLDGLFQIDEVRRVDDIGLNLCPCYETMNSQECGYERSWQKLVERCDLDRTTVLICGYTQSWRYTIGVEDSLRRQLRFRDEIRRKVDAFLADVRPRKWDATTKFRRIGVHLRRGDNLAPHFVNYGFSVPDKTYYEHAVRYVIVNQSISTSGSQRVPIQFIVASDDIAWMKDALDAALKVIAANESFIDVVYSEGRDPGFDFALLASCNSSIMSTGTYGWWSSWLANGMTIYYKNWPRPGTGLDRDVNKEDFFPAHWIAME